MIASTGEPAARRLFDRAIRHYQREGAAHFLVETASSRHAHLRNLEGDGHMEMRVFDSGLTIGRGVYRLDRERTQVFSAIRSPIGFSIILSGHFDLSIPALGVHETVRKDRVWLRSGTLPSVRFREPAEIWMRGVSVDMDDAQLAAWREDGLTAAGGLGRLARLAEERRCEQLPAEAGNGVREIASRMLSVDDTTVCGRLHLESLGLEMLARLVDPEASIRAAAQAGSGPPCRTALDDAADILTAEFDDPPTISQLSRRVGMNECYLKARFRVRFGMTVGGFVRTVRMRKAHALIIGEGCTVQQAAALVGYTNASHFAVAFRAVHGVLPSDLRRRP